MSNTTMTPEELIAAVAAALAAKVSAYAAADISGERYAYNDADDAYESALDRIVEIAASQGCTTCRP